MRLVRDAEPAADVDQPQRHPGRHREPASCSDRGRRVMHERHGVEHVRRPEGMQPEQLEVRRGDRSTCASGEVRRVHPELAGPVVTDEPDTFRRASLGDGRPEQDRLAAPELSRDRLEPSKLAGRLDRDRADPGRHRGAQLIVALARPGHHDPLGADPGPTGGRELAAGGDIGAETEPAEMRDDGQRRVRLDRVGQLDDRREDRPSAATWRSMTSRS